MKCLVVYCHPLETSFCHALFECVVEALQSNDHEVQSLDLYALNFAPALSAAERAAYETDGDHRTAIAPHIAQLVWAEALVFVYPTWWYGLPAVLKGWLDRVWLPGVAFTLPDDGSAIQPTLTHIRHLSVISTCGASFWLSKFVGEPGRKTLMRGARLLLARRCKTAWLAHYNMDASTDASRARFLSKVAAHCHRL